MKLYATLAPYGLEGSFTQRMFGFLNTLMSETKPIRCPSVKASNRGFPNCHVCCHALAQAVGMPDNLVAMDGIYAGAVQHGWLLLGVDDKALAILDVYPVNASAPVLHLIRGQQPPYPMPDPPMWEAALKKIYEAPQDFKDFLWGEHSGLDEDIARMAEAFRATQARLGLETPMP